MRSAILLLMAGILGATDPSCAEESPAAPPDPAPASGAVSKATSEPATEPYRLDIFEREAVQLVLLDVVVLDRQDRTVTGLTAADFEIFAGSGATAPDTFDVQCAEALDDPHGVNRAAERRPAPPVENGRRVVIALDYQHLNAMQRVDVLERARDMVRYQYADGDRIMVAALNGGLRIEQPFTTDRDAVVETLRRMEYDITLWQPSFFHLNEGGWVDGMTALLDVITTEPGRKAMVLYSAMTDVPLDLQFQRIAAQATTARCAIYPVDAMGLRTNLQDDVVRGRTERAVGGGGG